MGFLQKSSENENYFLLNPIIASQWGGGGVGEGQLQSKWFGTLFNKMPLKDTKVTKCPKRGPNTLTEYIPPEMELGTSIKTLGMDGWMDGFSPQWGGGGFHAESTFHVVFFTFNVTIMSKNRNRMINNGDKKNSPH